MKILTWQDPQTLDLVKRSLKLDKISVVSTDTILGLLGQISNNSYQKLDEIKCRQEKSYIVLLDTIKKLRLFTDFDETNLKLTKLVDNFWPGPLTLIFKVKETVPEFLKNRTGTIAIRIPKHQYLLRLLNDFDGLFSTSANISGQSAAQTIDEIDNRIIDSADYIVIEQYKENHRYTSLPSTILDCTTDKIKIVREGALTLDVLKEYLD